MEVRALMDGDPAMVSGRGFRYEVFPMLRAIVPAQQAVLAKPPPSSSRRRGSTLPQSRCGGDMDPRLREDDGVGEACSFGRGQAQ
jgi:hypothetical protein